MNIYIFIVSILVLSEGESSASEGHAQKFQGKTTDVVERVRHGVINLIVSVREEPHSSSAGMNRKLMTRTTPASITITTSSKKLQGKTTNSFSLKTSPVPEEVIDMAQMDYSPAKKRSPIHN